MAPPTGRWILDTKATSGRLYGALCDLLSTLLSLPRVRLDGQLVPAPRRVELTDPGSEPPSRSIDHASAPGEPRRKVRTLPNFR